MAISLKLTGLVVRDANDQFAEVFAFEQTNEGLWSLLKAIDDVFTKFDLAFIKPSIHLVEELAITMTVVVEDNETLYLDALAK